MNSWRAQERKSWLWSQWRYVIQDIFLLSTCQQTGHVTIIILWQWQATMHQIYIFLNKKSNFTQTCKYECQTYHMPRSFLCHYFCFSFMYCNVMCYLSKNLSLAQCICMHASFSQSDWELQPKIPPVRLDKAYTVKANGDTRCVHKTKIDRNFN